ncbi:hypothetical protein [Mucilaginibacter sp.]|uniref:hypothetical protein n=1 Tax=Mucilaginibacter sp. TaxID=1882438 RepID=UPI0025FC39A2|nr:hypothetical protein [Mucilaginibacter sp.]
MEVTQDLIVKYLKQDFIAISKSSTEEELYMKDYLLKKDLMSISGPIGTAITNSNGKDFIHNAYFFNPVPLNVYDWKINIINQLKNGEKQLDGSGDTMNMAKSELTQDGIIEIGSTPYYRVLTSNGRRFNDSGLSLKNFLNSDNRPISIRIGHDISGDVHGSDLSMDMSRDKQIINNKTETTKTKKSVLEWVFVIIGFIASLIGIYWFFTK